MELEKRKRKFFYPQRSREFQFLTIFTLEIYTEEQFKSDNQRCSNHSMTRGPLRTKQNYVTHELSYPSKTFL